MGDGEEGSGQNMIKTLAAMSRDEAEEQTARRVTEGKMGQRWALYLEEWQEDMRHWPGTL